ncbi:MAG: tRNA (adenosine(37)-N6)-dimethylallyltransferase MiaA [Burkholderiaceae bacterium]|nr:tRNA (adenosine(37)-N6)-dimethylallyltransferase MiaA [Burkholderiaceae bacterium]
MSGAAPLVLLLGPTASGKSEIALRLAQHLPIEIVSVDSAQVYRGLDVGTAKPDAAERAAVAHHLIDIVEPTERYSAARFVDDALAAIARIRARARVPLLVGGTMLYARALTEGLHALPAADAAVRARLDDEARALGWPALHARLARIDPRAATRIEPSDRQRIQRALEIFETSGRTMSDWLSDPTPRAPSGDARIVTIALEPVDRAALHARIAARFDAMLAGGLVDEVRALRARGDLSPSLPSMRSVGYRQAWQWLDTGERIEALREAGIAATRQLAKRQLTWLRTMDERIAIDPFAADAFDQVTDALDGLGRQGRTGKPAA